MSVLGSHFVSITNSTINGDVGISLLNQVDTTNITFTGNTVTGSSNRLAVFAGDAHTIGNCDTTGYTINNNTFTNTIPVVGDNAVNVFLSCTENGSFSNNTVNSPGQATGLLIRDGYSHNTMSGNTIHVNQAVNDSRGAIAFVSGSTTVGPATFNTLSGNTVKADNGKALFMYDATGTSNTGTLFQNNLFVSNSGAGSQEFYTTTDASNPNVFSHNTFIEHGTGYAFGFPDDGMVDGMENTVLHDNIFVAASGPVIGGDTAPRAGFVANHNLYYNRSGAASFTGIGNFNAWKTATGDTSSLEANPLFVDYTNGNYHLQATSPAVGAGTGGSDIGAYGASGSCTESWSCGSWSTCTNNTQSRTCADANSCNTFVNQPALTQSCDSTAPTVSLTAPTNGTTVSATVSVTATASDNVGVVGVQFKLDGVNLGSEDASSPYSVSWNTTGATNASHTLTAVARDAAGLTTTATTVIVTVNNVVACTESWSYSAWSTCVNGTQTRTATDANHCGTTVNRQPLTQSCSSPDLTPPSAVDNLQVR